MKKMLPILIVMTFLVVISLGTIQVQAEATNDTDVEITLEGPTDITRGTRMLALTLKLGNMSGVEEGNVMAFDTTLEYSSELFTSVNVIEQNGWDVTYEESTRKIVGIIDKSTANKDIAQIVFTLKDEITPGVQGAIKLNNFTISDDNHLSKTVNEIKKDINIVEDVEKSELNQQNQAPNISESGNENNNDNNNENEENNKPIEQEKQTEVVTSGNSNPAKGLDVEETATLPKAGLQNLVIIAIVLISLMGIGSYIRQKSIKIK